MRLLLILAAVCLSGCAILPRNAVPVDRMPEAVVPGMPDVRALAGRLDPAMQRDLETSFGQESAADFPVAADGRVHYSHLVLSGGGANGAFGAGFLSGWTQSGKRPVFKIVTGVSTGALMAPYAFLGPDYDDAIREFYTNTSSRNVFQMLSIIPQLLGGESLADSGPLRQTIEQTVDDAFLRAIARAHQSGRRLYIGTTDLDAQSFVIWNMGAIAASGQPGSLELFRSVMLASASIPIAFPPVFIEVEAGSRRFDELHVDGAVVANLFYSGGVFNFAMARKVVGRGQGREDIYIVHNGQLLPVPGTTNRSLRSIGTRAFTAAAKSATLGDLFRIFAFSLRQGAGYHWITIPNGIELAGDEVFDPVAMRRLYDIGFAKSRGGPEWATTPPGALDPPEP
ncbi:MAG TPA: patatin-like phospholipase family protein [Casimicrobiaceae bacterium]|nr:patatin-like phospholipase family protein [Casimicrobiaceae bacterium]